MPVPTVAAEAAMVAVLPKLAALLQEEEGGDGFIVKGGGARRDATFLRDETQKLRAFLEAHPQRRKKSYLKKQEINSYRAQFSWKLRDLFLEVEDSVDGFLRCKQLVSSGTKPSRRGFRRLADKAAGAVLRRRFAAQLRGFRSLLEESDLAQEWRNAYIFELAYPQRPSSEGWLTEKLKLYHDGITRLPPAPDADEARLAATLNGRRNEVARLVLAGDAGETDGLRRLRRAPARGLAVVSIFGYAGMGKTTLAWEVYRAIEEYFDCVAWVSALPRRDMNDVLRNILRQVEDDVGSVVARRDLLGSIRERLQHKRYLVVLDGMCNSEAWETISGALPLNDHGSRVIITTPCFAVAYSCSSRRDRIYHIEPLDFGDSWTLFHRRIFGSTMRCSPGFAAVAKRIVEKCSGIPLATATVSALLAERSFPWTLWVDVCSSISAPCKDAEITSIMSFSYHNLPDHLKLCLWHLGMFPEDHPIEHGRVVRSWIAEGLIWERHGKTVDEVGQRYLDDLMDWNMIQPDHGGEDKAYFISNVVLELIRFESGKENFAAILLDRKPASALPRKIQRLSIVTTNNGGHGILASMVRRSVIPASVTMSRIRSLYIFGGDGKNKLTLKHLTLVRVLDLQGCKDLKNHNVEEIAGLRNLRYLSIRDTPVSKIPDRIGHLHYLTTLDLRGTRVQQLPTSVLQLQRLKHLLCDTAKCQPVEQEELGNLSQL